MKKHEKSYENTLQDKLDNVDIDELRKLLNKSNIKRIQQQVVDQVGEYKEDDKLPKVSIEAVQEIDEQIEIINQDKYDLFITELTYLLSISDRTYEDEELIQDLFDNLAHIYKKNIINKN